MRVLAITAWTARARRMVRPVSGAMFALFCLLAAYAAAGMIGGALPANAGWRPPEHGVRIFIEDNGVHTGIVVPKRAAGVEWRTLVRAEHLADPRYAGHAFLSFGWGDRAFYENTPRWADVEPAILLSAALGSDETVLHVDHVPAPAAGPTVRAVLLRPEEYRRLATFIRRSFAADPRGGPGYGGWDAFYAARGRYSALRTCNNWTGEALRHAGVRVGRWTPFSFTVMAWF